jgi:pyruvate dehydrogenase E2 component (dihydrolipoamide acetyltransferase)
MSQRQEVRVPNLGDFHDVEIVEVPARAGDTVQVEAPLITLETDKAAMDVPAPAAGRIIEMKVKKGDRVSEGDLVAILEVTEAAATAPPATQAPAQTPPPAKPAAAAPRPPPPSAYAPPRPAPVLAPIDEQTFGKAHASPAVRKFARELGVNLVQVKGSGPKDRVLREDVQAYVKAVLSGQLAAGPGLPRIPAVDFAKYGEIEIQPLSRVRKIAGPRLHASWVNIPHVTQHDEADITELEARRQALKAKADAAGIKLTPLAFIIRACLLALKEFPDFNTSLTEDATGLVHKKYFHIGFAADTPQGLVVPVIRNADQKDLFAIATELASLSGKAREGKLTAEEMRGGTFTVSSLGGIGGTFFTPIVNAPEVAILGVGRSTQKPVWQGKAFVPRLTLPLSLSYDHRVIDGATGVRFTTFLVKALADVDRLSG